MADDVKMLRQNSIASVPSTQVIEVASMLVKVFDCLVDMLYDAFPVFYQAQTVEQVWLVLEGE